MVIKRIYVNEKVSFTSKALILIPDSMDEKQFNGILDRVQRNNAEGTFDDVLSDLREEGFVVTSIHSSYPSSPDGSELAITEYDDID